MSLRALNYDQRPLKKPSTFSSANDNIPFHHENTLAPFKVIDLFLEQFQHVLAAEDLPEMIQAVKAQLYQRDYLSAFDCDDKRLAYAARWTPARALAYSSLFASCPEISELFSDPNKKSRVLCVGGGAASELVGLASVFCQLKIPNGDTPSSLHMDVIDIADWSLIVNNVTSYVRNKWLYSPSKLSAQFKLGDVLAQTPEQLHLSELDLVTLLFTTNELFSEKRTETIKFLHSLSAHCRKGSLLLITESAGSYSHITVGLKEFPVQFLIDTILVGKPGVGNGPWEIVNQSESCWYRINDREVSYPIKLENMRFFYRLYSKK
ncbi:hypothetical protein METBIDRAFT_48087 [Metschnikowia bicuspidata var. bicuspidata NRRL YB-4993]|uniref:25S rRNA (Uridine(2843)-N(3))-methyltransferase n=1 Tax=Metschnikowia bicuspidata var. bicuspidata NRRL YB-4993 TaxID=869754 RepID=A0A1A0GZ54_9ASCO|nr:hypothetical protein METBIDRAFT_48087 [Metschnikowia bicuspidata var. bicuspidata NRRL YB-4993]OBA17008.1 hypothetical protein METBIDRAFT_48087 [Metschnikowia bicuspidata var. bicuspidata NRRL YB-4993]